MTSQLCNASSFESIAVSNASAEDFKQPLLVVVEDLESSPSFQEQEQEQEQNTDDSKQRVSTLILTKSLWIGAFAGLLLQLVTFSAFLVLFYSGGNNVVSTFRWGKYPQPNESTTLSYWTLYMLLHMDIPFYAVIWVGFVTALTRKGSLYLRKKFDNDADAPNSESVWTGRFLILNGVGFLLGLTTGSYTVWIIVDIKLGTPVPLVSLLSALLMEVGLCCLIIKSFDWGHKPEDDETEEDQEDPSYFI